MTGAVRYVDLNSHRTHYAANLALCPVWGMLISIHAEQTVQQTSPCAPCEVCWSQFTVHTEQTVQQTSPCAPCEVCWCQFTVHTEQTVQQTSPCAPCEVSWSQFTQNKLCSKPRPVPHHMVQSPGEFKGMIPLPLAVCSSRWFIITVFLSLFAVCKLNIRYMKSPAMCHSANSHFELVWAYHHTHPAQHYGLSVV